MTTAKKYSSNIDQLLNHLKPDSLAARLVTAYAQSNDENRDEAIKDVLKDRLSEIGRSYDQINNKKN